jgi:hypothetical protein
MFHPLLGHSNDNNILAEEEFQFRKTITTQDASYELSNEMVSAPNN